MPRWFRDVSRFAVSIVISTETKPGLFIARFRCCRYYYGMYDSVTATSVFSFSFIIGIFAVYIKLHFPIHGRWENMCDKYCRAAISLAFGVARHGYQVRMPSSTAMSMSLFFIAILLAQLPYRRIPTLCMNSKT